MTFDALVLAALLASGATPADDAAARAVMREALRQAAPLPSVKPSLPEGPLPAGQLTDASREMRRDAARMALEHAQRSVGRAERAQHGRGEREGAMGEAMQGEHHGGDCTGDPAEMMRSRGTMPGEHGQPMPERGPQHHGM